MALASFPIHTLALPFAKGSATCGASTTGALRMREDYCGPWIVNDFFPTLTMMTCAVCGQAEKVQEHWSVDDMTICVACFPSSYGDYVKCISSGCMHHVIENMSDRGMCDCCAEAMPDSDDDDDD